MVVQFELDLEDPGVTVSLDPDPTGLLLRGARAKGLVGEQLDPTQEVRLSGSLRITLDEPRAEALAADLFNSLKE